MSARIALAAFVLGAFVLAAGVFVGPMIGAAENDAQTVLELSDDESVEVTDTMQVEASINSSANNDTTVTVTNLRTLDSANTTLSVGEKGNVTVNGDKVVIEYDRYSGGVSTVTVTYPPTIGWADGPALFVDRLGLLLSLLGFAMIVYGGFAAVSVL